MNDHVIVVDLSYGDAGKGTVVDWLCANGSGPRSRDRGSVKAVIRFNGGAQAGHNVVTPDGRHHTFSQFGSGTLHGVPTHLSRFMLVDPLALSAEASALGNPYELLTIDPDAVLVTPWHQAANRKRETLRGQDRHGSCGMGVGEAAHLMSTLSSVPRVGDVPSSARLRSGLVAIRDRLTDELGELDCPPVDDVVDVFRAFGERVSISDRLPLDDPCVFEGAQGVLLDEWRGFHPHTTWSTTTFDNALALCPSAFRLGVVRTYTTRHGPGPLVTADDSLEYPEPHNGTGEWQGSFGLGHFDAVAHRYAIEVCSGVDALAVTHCDVDVSAYCDSYSTMDRIVPGPFQDLTYQQQLTDRLLAARPILTTGAPDIATLLGAPVLLESYGATHADKKYFAGHGG